MTSVQEDRDCAILLAMKKKEESATLSNARDIGGVYHDVTIKEGMLVRGKALLDINDAQKQTLLERFHVKTIIDLRSDDEQKEEPNMAIEGTRQLSIPIFQREKQGISHTQNEKPDSFRIYRILPKMGKIYENMLHGESLDNMAKVIRAIVNAEEEEYAFFFHCSEGKDRTGLVAAILLLLLGVSEKEIVHDYLKTNKVSNKKAFKYYLAIKYLHFQPLFALKVGRMFRAKKEYIQVLFDVIKNEYGSNEAFFKKAMKLSKEEIEDFRNRLIISR